MLSAVLLLMLPVVLGMSVIRLVQLPQDLWAGRARINSRRRLLCALAFILLFGYAIARPSTESLFLEHHGAGALPWAWLGVALDPERRKLLVVDNLDLDQSAIKIIAHVLDTLRDHHE